MRESRIESRLVLQVAVIGGMAEKFNSKGKKNVPDRIVSWPGGRVHFVETKAPGEKPRPGQARDHARRRAMGFEVYVLDTIDKVDAYVATMAGRVGFRELPPDSEGGEL